MYEKVRFGCCVKKTELRDDGSWEVSYEKENKGEVKVKTKKPVLATGTTSLPHMPEIKGRDYFKGHVFHSKELPFRGEDMENSENVVVMGGSKSAIDSVYINAIKGRHVDWVIRESGKGLAWLSPAFVSPLKLQFEKLATVRAMTFLSPCFDSTYSPIRYLLHNTRIGRAFVRGFFSIIHGDLLENGKFNAHPDTKKLISPGNIFWSGTSNVAYIQSNIKISPCRVVDQPATKASLYLLSTNLLLCSNIISQEAARVFYNQNTFSFLGEHNWDPIVSWLQTIGVQNRNNLSNLEIDAYKPDQAWQRFDGERIQAPGGNTREIVYPRHPYLGVRMRPFKYGFVDNINPALETMFELLGQRASTKKLVLNLKLCGGYPGDGKIIYEGDQHPEDG
ncbi:hypothetical protein G7Y89_g8745 [Cudoniella acicularis]|uniref:L-ornithine N(5)-oxygenase n=1 Tax=Cudoniella acicularis TaxID=354080 RepID=A0A8H4RG12_9HELO|nr:hypothetical protein G7Y89_g8745 [Cudoniella acicularis]